jgi:hypothetical protein
MIRPGWFHTATQKNSIVPANLNPQDPHPPPGRLDQVARGSSDPLRMGGRAARYAAHSRHHGHRLNGLGLNNPETPQKSGFMPPAHHPIG